MDLNNGNLNFELGVIAMPKALKLMLVPGYLVECWCKEEKSSDQRACQIRELQVLNVKNYVMVRGLDLLLNH